MKIAACYIRVSTDDQTELSPTSQLKSIQEYAKLHDFYIPDEFIFADEGISGRTVKKRPQFQKMIQIAKTKPKPFDAVLLWKFSRFARNRSDAIVYKKLLRDECGIDVISISENLGTDEGTALILESMFEAMDEYYSINLSGEVKRSMTLKAEQGKPLSIAPYGYKMVEKALVVDEEQARVIHFIFDAFTNGVGQRTIAKKLVEMGIKTNRGNNPDNRYVEYILRNPVYIGKIRWSKSGRKSNTLYRYVLDDDPDVIISEGKHEAIITEEQFQRAQEMIAARKQMYRPYQRTEKVKHDYALRGLITCDKCGATLVLTATAEPGLQCYRYAKGQCSVSHFISMKKINEIVSQALHYAVGSLDFEVVPRKTKQEQNELDVLKRILESEEKKLLKIKDAYEAGIDTIDEYRQNKQRIMSEIANIKEQIKSCQVNTAIDKKEYAKKIKNVTEIFDSLTVSEAEKNEALRTIIEKIVFYRPESKVQIIFYT